MTEAPGGTPVGVEDPYGHVEACDHLTDDGRCRFAVERYGDDPEFAAARRADDYACPVVDPGADPGPGGVDEPAGDWDWADCPHFRSLATDRECARCGLAGRRLAHDDERPLLEEHHLAYPGDGDETEITVYLCRWCHSTVHDSWGSLADDVNPDPEALAERERRRSREHEEAAFETAAERFDREDS
jgi:hypothetical protein